jgi:membrane protease YdiL (CAAX protease family)
MLLILQRHGLSAADAGQRLADAPLTLAVAASLMAVLAVVSWIVLKRVRRAKPATRLASAGRLRKLVPNLGLEMAAFAIVCLTAGVCEELLYRGWLINLLRAATGSLWAAAVASSILFGAAHAYQGVKGILRATFVGLQLAALYVLVGSLIPGQFLHAGVDLLAGVAGALSLARPRPDPTG